MPDFRLGDIVDVIDPETQETIDCGSIASIFNMDFVMLAEVLQTFPHKHHGDDVYVVKDPISGQTQTRLPEELKLVA